MGRMAISAQKRVERAAIGERLKMLRRAIYGGRGSAQVAGETDLAHRLGTQTRTLLNWEGGQAMPIETTLRLISITGVSPAWLLTGEGRMFSAPPVTLAGNSEFSGRALGDWRNGHATITEVG